MIKYFTKVLNYFRKSEETSVDLEFLDRVKNYAERARLRSTGVNPDHGGPVPMKHNVKQKKFQGLEYIISV